MSPPLRILITTLELDTRRGVQNVTRDLANGLRAAGHTVTLYTRKGGPVADDLREAGFQVEVSVQKLDGPFDVIHAHHPVSCSPVLAGFPEVPAIFVCHDNVSWFDAAVRLPNFRRYVGVSEALVGRIAYDTGIERSRIKLILNGVDTKRFAPGQPLPDKPRRALAFAKNADHMAGIREACAQRGIAVDFVGAAAGRSLLDPSIEMPTYDLVFASALTALEAMSCLRPVICCDGRGMAGMIDRARYEAWRPENFGHAVLTGAVSTERTLAEIDRYDPQEAMRVGERMRAEGGMAEWIDAYVDLYREAIAAPPEPQEQWPVQWAQHLERWTPRPIEHWGWTHERQALVNEVRRLRAGAEVLPVDNRLVFGKEGAAARFVDPVGFEAQPDGSVWTSSRFASVRFRPGPLQSGFAMALEYAVYLPAADFGLEVVALLNGVEVDRWTESGFENWAQRVRTLMLPGDLCHPASTWLAFRFSQVAGAAPPRAPAFNLQAVTFRLDPNADKPR